MIVNDFDELDKVFVRLRSEGKRIVFTNGVFDIMHVGHLRYLKAAQGLGDVLIVAVNSDASVQRLKGPQRPIVAQDERQEMLDGLRCVDYVTLFGSDTPVPLVARFKPDIYTKGGDYTVDSLPESPVVHGYGGQVVILPFVDGKSSTNIIERIAATRSA